MILTDSMGAVISKTYLKMRNGLAKVLHAHQVTPEQWSLLRMLWQEDGISQKELSIRCFKDQPTTARILDKLECRALICRHACPEDKRAFLIELTHEGKALQSRLVPLAAQHLERALKGLSEEDQNQLRTLLNKIIENLD